MQWRFVVELLGADGAVQVHEVHSRGNGASPGISAQTLGLTLTDAKAALARLQRHLVQMQTEEHCQARRRCPRCGAQRPLQDRRPRRLRSLFGVVEVLAPRFAPCRCSVTLRSTLSPVTAIMPDRRTPELERVLAKLGALLPYRRARALRADFFPIGEFPAVETMRQRTLQVGAGLERASVAPLRSGPPTAAEAIAVAIDAGHVRAVPSYQARSIEIFVAQASNDGQQITFSSVPLEADRQSQQLRRVLHELGATPRTEVTILSDGAEGPRGLGEAASISPTSHVLDWFHLSMRIQHVAQVVKNWPETTAEGRQEGAWLADAVEHVRWRLWHGQVQRALDLIADTLAALEAMAATSSPVAAQGAQGCTRTACPGDLRCRASGPDH